MAHHSWIIFNKSFCHPLNAFVVMFEWCPTIRAQWIDLFVSFSATHFSIAPSFVQCGWALTRLLFYRSLFLTKSKRTIVFFSPPVQNLCFVWFNWKCCCTMHHIYFKLKSNAFMCSSMCVCVCVGKKLHVNSWDEKLAKVCKWMQ